jgi:hypothetical protein
MLKEQFKKLVQSGADPDVVDRILTVLAQDPRHRFLVMLRTGTPTWPNRRAEAIQHALSLEKWMEDHEALTTTVPALEALEALAQHPSFPQFASAFQLHVRKEIDRLTIQFARLIAPIYMAWQQADADPLVRLLERDRPVVRRRGRPSRRMGTAVMALITRHLRVRTGRRHTQVVAEVTQVLFPGTFSSKARRSSGWPQEFGAHDHSFIGIEDRARDRLRRFDADVDAILAAL